MDQPAQDGNFYYQNEDLQFNLVLPPEFLYYQTQRKTTDDFIDIEFFVPTSDSDYPQEAPGYAKPIVIRVFSSQDSWEKEAEKNIFQELGKGKGWWIAADNKIYTIKFWDKAPSDWQSKWKEEMREAIIDSFEIK